MPPLIGSSVDVRGEDDIPEQRRGGQELDRDERTFLIHLRRTDHGHLDALLRFWIFQSELGALGKAFGKNDHAASSADRMSKSLDRLGVFGDVDEHGHAQENALGAAPLLRGWLARRQGRVHATYRTGFRVRRRFYVGSGFHSSSPQKSISGATSSTPYSQPSGRWLPFHTIIAALLVSVARLLRARRCSISSDSARTTMQ